jgi:hypothetical protein
MWRLLHHVCLVSTKRKKPTIFNESRQYKSQRKNFLMAEMSTEYSLQLRKRSLLSNKIILRAFRKMLSLISVLPFCKKSYQNTRFCYTVYNSPKFNGFINCTWWSILVVITLGRWAHRTPSGVRERHKCIGLIIKVKNFARKHLFQSWTSERWTCVSWISRSRIKQKNADNKNNILKYTPRSLF